MNFINISRASAAELTYLVGLASELDYIPVPVLKELEPLCTAVCAQLEALLQRMELILAEESRKDLTRD